MAKGSRRRPTTIPLAESDANFENIFGKRVPTYLKKIIPDEPVKEVDELQDYIKQAQETWNDSCTSPRKKEE